MYIIDKKKCHSEALKLAEKSKVFIRSENKMSLNTLFIIINDSIFINKECTVIYLTYTPFSSIEF